ncbi:unnamed protein product [Camellia sinensis]
MLRRCLSDKPEGHLATVARFLNPQSLNHHCYPLTYGLEKEVTPSSKVRADVVRSGFMNTQKGASDGCRDGNKVFGRLHRYEHLSRMAAIDESESLSDIDDVEVVKYLHSKEEMHYKKIIWEQMNRKHETNTIQLKHAILRRLRHAVLLHFLVRPRKRSTEAKKDAPARKASKTTDRVANEKRLSSRINYDALEKLNAELSQGAENANTEGIIAKCDTKFNKKFSTNSRESERRKYDDEFDHRTNYDEGVESCGDYDSALYYGHEEAGYACGVDYDYEDSHEI